MIKKPDVCRGCPLYGSGHGFVPADGSGTNGVLMVLEAAGADEENLGVPVVGKAGQYLWTQLKRVGLERDAFRIHNVLSCRPPDNKLAGEPYEQNAIDHCSLFLDLTIADVKAKCEREGKTPVILALGKIAFKRLLGLEERRDKKLLSSDYYCYPFWSDRYNAWVIAAPHPSYLMRGKHSEVGILQFAAQRAVEIAAGGLTLDTHAYHLDPLPSTFRQWVADYKAAYDADPDNTFLSYDIETPYKQGKNEDEVAVEDSDDYTILRISFSYRPNDAVSVAWTAEHLPLITELLEHRGAKVGWNNETYDAPRIKAAGIQLNGDQIDGMLAWHVLNSTLPKSLGFVTPYYAQTTSAWKHLSTAEPAFYNAKDADMALRNWLGIRSDLKRENLWGVFDRHVIQLNRVLDYMSKQGLRRDDAFRADLEKRLTDELAAINAKIEEAVPFEAKELHVYKKTPKDTTGMVQTPGQIKVKTCPSCGALGVKAEHTKSVGKKKLKAGCAENPCHGSALSVTTVTAQLWAKPLPFRISATSLSRYQKVKKHQPVVDWKTKRVTFDENAMKRLMRDYPKDPLYPLIGELRYLTKLLGTYVGKTQEDGRVKGGMPLGRDGLGHVQYSHNPSTLRLSCPFFHQLPRPDPKNPDAPHNGIRNMITAADGNLFLARDFSGIEAVLVGYEARFAPYIRLAKLDVHTFYTLYALYELERRIPSSDLPDFNWPDDKLIPHLAHFKKLFSNERNSLYKHLTHAINFGQGPKGAAEKIYKETNILHPIPKIAKIMSVYKNLFPQIVKWQNDVREQAHKDGYLRNAFGYVHRFNHVYRYELEYGEWKRKLGDDAEAVLAFKPQSNAAGIIKEAMLRLYENHYEAVGQYLRLQVHDEIFTEVPEKVVHDVDAIMKAEMEAPITCMPLPASYGMGDYLTVLTEEKIGKRWGGMK